MVPRLRAWLAEHGEPLAALRDDVQRARQRLREGEATARTRLLGEELAALAAQLSRFAAAPDGALAQVRARLRWAETIAQRSIGDFAAAWDVARAGIRASPFYGGIDVPPQVGLVPLGPDPESGLWELAHLASGAGGAVTSVPVRDAQGRLLRDAAMGFVFVLVPGGTWWLGAQAGNPHAPNLDAEAYGSEGPPYQVRLDPFLLSKYEVTQAQWRRLRGCDPSYHQEGTPRHDGQQHSLLQPVEQVTWGEAIATLRPLGLDLPTAAQWECGARGRTSTARYTGGDVLSLLGFENLYDRAWSGLPPEGWALPYEDGFSAPSPVGTFRANPFGLHDVYGNVAEWCRDPWPSVAGGGFWYELTVARAGDGLRMAVREDRTRRIVRGGTFGAQPRSLRSAVWAAVSPDTCGPNGLRPVRAVHGWRDE